MKKHILIINGPNLNMLGIREPEIYGKGSLKDLNDFIKIYAKQKNIKVTNYQSNSEGNIVTCIQKLWKKNINGLVINPGALTHYSYSIRDAIKAVEIQAVEVHISDIYNREEFRKISVIKDVCIMQICGRGFSGYTDAIDILCSQR